MFLLLFQPGIRQVPGYHGLHDLPTHTHQVFLDQLQKILDPLFLLLQVLLLTVDAVLQVIGDVQGVHGHFPGLVDLAAEG